MVYNVCQGFISRWYHLTNGSGFPHMLLCAESLGVKSVTRDDEQGEMEAEQNQGQQE